MTEWSKLTDEEFISRALGYGSQKNYAQSFGLKRPSKGFRDRIHSLGIVFDGTNLVSREEFVDAVNNSDSITGVVKYLNGGVFSKSYYYLVHRLSNKYELALPKYRGGTPPAIRIPDQEIFVKGVKRTGNTLRNRMIEVGVPYRCSSVDCPLHTPGDMEYIKETYKVRWLDGLITIQVDHIDGDNTNNVRSNLRFLCPNCHSTTETYSGKNIKKDRNQKQNTCVDCEKPILRNSVRCRRCATTHTYSSGTKYDGTPLKIGIIDWPSPETIILNVEEHGYKGYGRILGVSDNSIRKRLRSHGVHHLPQRKS